MRTPQHTVELLRRLQALGFDDLAFSHLHHWRAVGRSDSIEAHASYCAGRQRFVAGGTNERVQERLERVYNGYTNGGFQSGKQEVFVALAEAAWHDVPHTPGIEDER